MWNPLVHSSVLETPAYPVPTVPFLVSQVTPLLATPENTGQGSSNPAVGTLVVPPAYPVPTDTLMSTVFPILKESAGQGSSNPAAGTRAYPVPTSFVVSQTVIGHKIVPVVQFPDPPGNEKK